MVLSVFAAAVVGGLGSIPGAVAGAFVIGVGEEFSLVVSIPSYRTAVGFVAILLSLSFRPRGLLGERADLMDNYLLAMAVFAGFYASWPWA